MMSKEWPIARMEDLCEITSSKRIYANELTPSGVPFYRSKEIIEKLSGQETHSGALFISEDRFQEILRLTGAPTEGDLLLTSRGTLGVPYLVTRSDRFHFADGNLTWFRKFNKLDSKYLKYYLLSAPGKAELAKCVIGSSQQAYTITALRQIAIAVPPLPEQHRIAGILSAYDELIANNQRRIAVLEEMARALYREWFVYFRAPGVKMKEGDEVPEGWVVKSVASLVDRKRVARVYREADISEEGAVPVIDQSTSELLGYHDNEPDLKSTGDRPLILFGDHTCKQRLLFNPFSIGPNTIVFETATNRSTVWLYYALLGIVNTQEYKRHWSQLVAKEVHVPAQELTDRFASLIRPWIEQIAVLSNANRVLRRTRDLLLPRLMSGRVELSLLQEHVETE